MNKEVKELLLIKKPQTVFSGDIIETTVYRGEVTHVVRLEALRSICNYLKTDPDLKFNFLADVIGVDLKDKSPRFEVLYQLYSIHWKLRLRLKVRVDEGEFVPSVTSIWASADWAEREIYDMYGVLFEGHPNLKRIYLPNDWEGFPLRKDYPIKGFKDRYNPFGVDKD